MLEKKSFLSVDFGAGNLKVAEFDVNEAGVLRLLRYGIHPLGRAGAQDATRKGAVQRGLNQLIGSRIFTSRVCNACPPGYQVFHKFIKLPAVDPGKVTQIIQFEAQQNIPFPLDQVIWDYSILGALPSGELEVLLVAVKTNYIEDLFQAAEKVGLRIELVDAPPAALSNAFRYNYADLEGCSMLIDIGARSSSVMFFDGDRFFCRSINIGANSITQDFAIEAKLPFAEAEKIKIAEGFVGLGGAYEEPENPHQAAISKIARQVMTRLHIQINQTLQFYRTQLGGRPPERVFLSGGGATMPYTVQFFQEKLNLPVEYFNPFRNIDIDPSVDVEELAKVAHTLGEVVGLGLRTPARCPVEINLMPKHILKRQQFNQKKPYLMVSFGCLVLAILTGGWFFNAVAKVRLDQYQKRQPTLQMLQQKERQFKQALNARDEAKKKLDQYTEWIDERFYWGDLITELGKALLNTETKMRRPGIRPNIWIEVMLCKQLEQEMQMNIRTEKSDSHEAPPGMSIEEMIRYGLVPPGANVSGAQMGGGASMMGLTPEEMAALGMTPGAQAQQEDTNVISELKLRCRAISWNSVYATADSELAYTFLHELLNSPFFVGGTNGTQLVGEINNDPATHTFSFEVKVKLARPIKLNL